MGRCKSPTCLLGKTVLITGGNAGIGFETALALAGRGCRVIIADKNNCEKSKGEIIRRTGNRNIVTKQFDLASLKSVRALAKDINETEERLDILINNAGAAGLGNSYTEDGIHIGMQVNHFGHFLLTHLLVGLLKKSAPSRIIFVASEAAAIIFIRKFFFAENAPTSAFSQWVIYANSKLCNIITANEMAKRLEGTGVTVNSLYPGVVGTPLFAEFFYDLGRFKLVHKLMDVIYDYFIKGFVKTPEEGAQTALHLALDKELETVTGKYFRDCQSIRMPYYANDLGYCRKVWQASEKLVQLEPKEKL